MELRPTDFPETIQDEQRGCGTLKDGAAYLRADIGSGGVLPPFVKADPPIPYKESHFRSWQVFPGLSFEIATTVDLTEYEPAGYDTPVAEFVEKVPFYETKEDIPNREYERHIGRLVWDDPRSDHVGSMRVSRSHDLLMWVGESHYEEAEDFIRECVHQGINKRIPVSKNKLPVINPGRTRLWVIHPNAIPAASDDDEPTAGIIGYAYLTRAIYTEPSDGHVPEHIQSKQRDGLLDVVEIGAGVEYTDPDHPRHEEKTDADEPEPEPEPDDGPESDPEGNGESSDDGEKSDSDPEESDEDDVDEDEDEDPDPISPDQSAVPTVDDW